MVLLDICKFFCELLIVYYLWYVEAFGNSSIVYILFIFALLFFILFLFNNGGKMQLRKVPYIVRNNYLLLVYCSVFGLISSYDKSFMYSNIMKCLGLTTISFIIFYVSSIKQSINWLLKVVYLSCIICCIHMLFFGYYYAANRIVLSSINNPNMLGMILSTGIFSVVYMFNRVNSRELVFNIVRITPLLYCTIMTGSRKALLFSITIIIVYLIYVFIKTVNTKNAINKIVLLLIIIIIIATVYYIYINYFVNTATYKRIQNVFNEVGDKERIKMYKEAIEIFKEHPLFGVGLNQFRFYSSLEAYSHSTYAESLSCFGIIGSLIYFLPIVYTLVYLIKITKYKNSFKLVITCSLLVIEIVLGTTVIYFYDFVHYIILGIVGWVLDSNYEGIKYEH